jgi:hypothetical protein
MPTREYAVDGDEGFIGLNSRDNPVNLGKNYVSKAQNIRMDRGVATVRKGAERLTQGSLVGQTIYGACSYTTAAGQELIILAVSDGIYKYTPDTEALSAKIVFPGYVSGATYSKTGSTVTVTKTAHGLTNGTQLYVETSVLGYGGIVTITAVTTNTFQYAVSSLLADGTGTATYNATNFIAPGDEVELYQAQGIGYVYILRGFNKSVLRWDGTTTIVVPDTHTHTNYPNSRHAIYYGNRHIVQTDRNTIQVSHYLEDNHWSALDVFTINDGSSDTLVAVTPWTLNEFVIFMRNSIFYAAAGVGANAVGDPAQEVDSYIKSLASDIGCIAKGSIVQAGGGILFLSDNGVYILNPAGAGNGAGNTPEGMRLLTIAEPLSAPVSDVIARINFNAVDKAIATYWENRYYLAVPLDNSTVNNAVLVYNFLNKAWESVDTYNPSQAIEDFVVAKKGNRRRMFMVDRVQGLYLLEQLDWDEYDNSIGSPELPFYIPATLSALAFQPVEIDAELITRAYSFQTNREKRFSSVQIDAELPAGGAMDVTAITVNPDTNTLLNSYGSPATEDVTLRFPVRKSGYYAQIKMESKNLRPSFRSVTVEAIVPGQMTQTKK